MNYRIKQIKDYPNYLVDTNGDIWTSLVPNGTKSGIWRKLRKHKRGPYYNVAITNKDGKRYFSIHRLVAMNFLSNPKNNPLVCHKNGKHLDNRLENLYWGTYASNQIDSVNHGTHSGLRHRGEKHPNAKLNDLQVRVIKHILNNQWLSTKEIANIFKVSLGSIKKIASGAKWKHILI